jgi:hypothetical protein
VFFAHGVVAYRNATVFADAICPSSSTSLY